MKRFYLIFTTICLPLYAFGQVAENNKTQQLLNNSENAIIEESVVAPIQNMVEPIVEKKWIQPIVDSLNQSKILNKLQYELDSIRVVAENVKKDKQAIEELKKIIILQDSLYTVAKDSIAELQLYKKEAMIYYFLNRTDVSVFGDDYIELDKSTLSSDLKNRYESITQIRNLALCLAEMEQEIKKGEENSNIKDGDKKAYMAIVLKSYIDNANAIFNKMDKLNLEVLSLEQKRYREQLTEKLNDILTKYIF